MTILDLTGIWEEHDLSHEKLGAGGGGGGGGASSSIYSKCENREKKIATLPDR